MKRTTTETALNRSGFIEDAVTVPEENGEGIKNHPHFIEANTSGITLRELTEKNIIPTFSDNSLTISHQNFIGAVAKAAEEISGEPVDQTNCRIH